MQSEIVNIERSISAAIFGLGCLLACFRFQMEKIAMPESVRKFSGDDPFVVSAMICGLLAGTIGLVYLVTADAPASMIMINGLTLAIGIMLAVLLRLTLRIIEQSLSLVAVTCASLLFATALFGYGIEGASRWFAIGPYMVQPSLILLPLVAICYGRHSGIWNAVAVVLSAAAMAIQPDRAMAGMLFLAILLIAFARPSNGRFAVSLFCALMFVVTMVLPDQLTAVPFVDHILWTAFDISIFSGLSLWIGCALLLVPIIFASSDRPGLAHLVFATCWLAVIVAAAMGAYPTPIVGYGASSILGYFLSIVLVEPKVQASMPGNRDNIMKGDRQGDQRTDFVPSSV